jgi:transcriptional regulator with XRE-family HTH domain
MRALARESGLSTNALSMIERGRTSPSVSTLYKLAGAMQIPITAFFRLEPPKQKLVYCKLSERTQVTLNKGLWEGLCGEAFVGRIEPFLLTLEVGAGSGPEGMQHTGSEFVFCLKGKLEYRVEEEAYILDPGDSLIFSAQMQHSWRNIGEEEVRALIVQTGFERGERPSEFHILSGKEGLLEESEED